VRTRRDRFLVGLCVITVAVAWWLIVVAVRVVVRAVIVLACHYYALRLETVAHARGARMAAVRR